MKPKPTLYWVEYIPLAVAALPTYEPHDPDPWFEVDDARTLRLARAIAAQRIKEGVIGATARIYRRHSFVKHARGWDYYSSEVE